MTGWLHPGDQPSPGQRYDIGADKVRALVTPERNENVSYPQTPPPGGAYSAQPGGPVPPQPGAPVPPPLPVAAPAPAKKSSAKRSIIILGILVVLIGGLFIAVKIASRNDANNAKVGDCLVGQSEDTIKKVDCAKAHDWKVVGKISDKTQTDASAEACAAQFSTAEAAYWWGEAGKKGDVLCHAPDTP